MINRATVEAAAGRLEAALGLFKEAAKLAPSVWQTHYNMGKVLNSLGRTSEAITAYKRAVKLAPGEGMIRCNLANILRRVGRLREAEQEYLRALAMTPDDVNANFGLALVLEEFGRKNKAEVVLRKVLALKPDFAEAHFSLAQILLQQGHYLEGWLHYEWRWRKKGFTSPPRAFGVPQWDGGELAGRTIVLHTEQGFGDALQFLRFVPLVAARGGRVILEVQSGLLALLQGYDGAEAVIERFTPLPFPADFHAPLMSIPHLLGTTLETIPAPKSYIHAPADLAATWKDRLAEFQQPRIGLVWAGNPEVSSDAQRSPGLRPLLPLLELDADFFGLQMGKGRQHLDGLSLPGNFHDMGAFISNMADTAAIVGNLDLVVSSCTSPAHLAAALGVPTFLMLAKEADWRWLEDREDSPWYPSARLFRQRKAGDWSGVVHRISLAVAEMLPR